MPAKPNITTTGENGGTVTLGDNNSSKSSLSPGDAAAAGAAHWSTDAKVKYLYGQTRRLFWVAEANKLGVWVLWTVRSYGRSVCGRK